MNGAVNSHTRNILRQQLHHWVQKLTTGDTSTLGPEAFYAQVCSFLNRAHQLEDPEAYLRLLRHFASELEVGVPLAVMDEFLIRALDESLLTADDYVELANVRSRLLMRSRMKEEILELLRHARSVAETEYQHALLANREAVYWELKSAFPESGALYREALTRARATDDPRASPLVAILLNNLGNWEYAQDHYAEALAYFKKALAYATEIDAVRWRAAAAGGIAMTCVELKEYDESFDYHELAEQLYRAGGNDTGVVRINLNRSLLAVRVGRISEAKEWAYAALDGAQRLEDAHRIASALHNLGLAYAVERDYVNAWHFLQEAFHQRTALGQTVFTQNSIKAIGEVSRAIRQELIAS